MKETATAPAFGEKASPRVLSMGATDAFRVDPVDIFACSCTYPRISPLVRRGWFIQKNFLFFFFPFWSFAFLFGNFRPQDRF